MAELYNNDTIGNGYQEQLQKEHHGSKWGSTGAKYSGNDVLSVLRNRPYIQTVLDFGAGKGSLGSFIKEELGRDIEWTDYDPGRPDIDTLPSGQFDCVVSTDVLEHIEPKRLDDVLRTLADKAGKVLISDIACYPTGKLFGEGPYKGQDLHLIIEEPTWWRERLKSTGLHESEFQWRDKYSKGNTKTRCFMIHERI